MATKTTVRPTDTETTACPECDGPIRQHAHESRCEDCGLITATNYLDRGPEWRPFEIDERQRTGPPRDLAVHDRGLGSQVGHGNNLSARKRQWQVWVEAGSHTDRARRYAFGEIHRLVDRLDLADVCRQTAAQLFEDAHDAGLATGRSFETLASAVLVAAARIHGEPVTFDAVAAVTRRADAETKDDSLFGTYQTVVEALGVPVPPPDPAGLVPGICRALGLEASHRTAAEAWCAEHGEALVGSGRNPKGVAAAAVYDAVGGQRNDRGVTQADVSRAAGITPVTLRAVLQIVEANGAE